MTERVRVGPSGDLDAQTAAGFEEELRGAITAAGTTAVVVDLAAVRFVDSAGLSALIKGRLLAAEHGVELWLTHPRPQLVRLLAMTATAAHFRFTA